MSLNDGRRAVNEWLSRMPTQRVRLYLMNNQWVTEDETLSSKKKEKKRENRKKQRNKSSAACNVAPVTDSPWEKFLRR